MDAENIALFLILMVIFGAIVYLAINREELGSQIAALDEQIAGKEEKQFDRVDEADRIKVAYDWRFKNRAWEFSAYISRQAYDFFREKGKTRQEHWLYVTDRGDDEALSELVTLFRQTSEEQGFSPYETVDFVISFVQSMPYTSDKITTGYDDYRRYPLETLADGGGDCEDTSILAAALLKEMGYGAVLLRFPNHMAVGVLGSSELEGQRYGYNGGLYYYLETTGEGWEIGELPKEYEGMRPEIIDIDAKPLLFLDWEITPTDVTTGFTSYEVEATVSNKGTDEGKNCKVAAAFGSKAGTVLSQNQQDYRIIEVGSVKVARLAVSVPRGIESRVAVSVSCDNYAKLERFSEWATS